MPKVPLRIPQIGEGLQEARVVALLKEAGDHVDRDEPIYQMETDKAVMDVECPYEGVLLEWKAKADQVLPIGAVVAEFEVAEGVEVEEQSVEGSVVGDEVSAKTSAAAEKVAPTARRRDVPPRTRAYAKSKGLSDADLEKVEASGARMMPEDVDAFLAQGGESNAAQAYHDAPLPSKQRVLNSRLTRGWQLAVPGTMTMVVPWEPIERLRKAYVDDAGEFKPSTFTMFAYLAAKTLADFPALRSSLIGEDVIRTQHNVHLGIAVALPGDELVLAVVRDADKLDWYDFAQAARERIEEARNGKDQASADVAVSLTNMQRQGVRTAAAVVVPPAVATVFLGEAYNELSDKPGVLEVRRCANLGITFDHRILNGVGAAEFLGALAAKIADVENVIPRP